MALSILAANNAQTVLAAGISSTATSLTVNTGTGSLFPSPSAGSSFFKLTLIDAATGLLTEIVHVTARSGDVMTIVRAQEGTSARAWSANDIAANMLTAGTIAMFATIDSPALTGTPTAPTASFGTNTTQIATMAALQTAKGALSGVYSVSSANTLTATAAGALVYMTGGATFTTTLPAGTTVALGQTIRLANYSTAAQTIATAGTDIIYGGAVSGSVSSVSMQAGASLALISRGNGEWDIIGGTNAVQYASGLGLVSPSLTGTPTAPTATAGTSTTQLATTAFVSNALTTVTGRLLAVKTFTASSVYTKTAGTQSIIVEVLGGGAPGGSAVTAGNYQACSGGGAGAFIRGRMTTVPASVSVTVGAGSAPGTSTGGVSAFGSYLTSGGGAAGSVAATTDPNTGCCVGGGAGGDATYDSANVQLIMMCRGGAGSLGIVSGVNGAAGNGGDSFFGGGGRGPATSSNIVGNDGYLGAGGSGAVKRVANTDTEAGGIGGNGLVVIYEYA
ncbi:glycine-rich domain-containing protein [Dickeya fangzhongdai]|uniref:glycine-rich domain-containing protein n=1 Tax=Dickeya fangzhongdai TaxID=1778540 RepID=UPI0023E40522|nr:hypothetical protein [Dickeya fangzhongdai]WES88766.1 hypothetical protein PQ617_21600 [Dickeya fangzhongdai]